MKFIETNTHNVGFVTFIFTAFILCFLVLILSWVLGGKSSGRSKNVPFESGIISTGDTHLHFSIKFYLVAMFFVIFDVEVPFLYAWAVSIRENGWIGFVESALFIFMFLGTLLYLVRVKALSWSPLPRNQNISLKNIDIENSRFSDSFNISKHVEK